HAQAALKWSKWLAEDDAETARRERDAANRWVSEMLDRRRRSFVEAHPEAAIAEVENKRRLDGLDAQNPLPFARTLNRAARKEAGFGEEDLAQLAAWGYVE